MDEPNNNIDEVEPEETPERPDIPEFVTHRTVGDMLAAERRRQGKTLTEVADSTNIRLRMLQAVEDGNYDYLPSQAYVKGYIQNYATVLGLSPEPFLEAFRQETPPTTDEGELEGSAALRDPILPKRDQAHAIPTRLLLGIAAFVLVVGVIWVTLSLVGGGEDEPQPLPPPIEEEDPASEPETAVPGVPETSMDATPEAEVAAQSFEMTVEVSGDDVSWLEVTVDGESAYIGMLSGGDPRTWEVTELATVLIGRPSVVTITRDGEPVPIVATGELPTVELSADD